MASSKKIGFFWGEEKITVVDFDRNAPVQVVCSPLGSKASTSSPFSSNLTEEIQVTAILQRLLQDNQISGGSFYVSLPMKEIILRSFIIPFVKQADVQNAIKFEAKKYMPFDIQDLSFIFHTIPFAEGQNKRLQVIFFAARKEVLARYDRIFKGVNAQVAYAEPYMVSLTKALLFKKEIKPTDHLAFLILDKHLGRICFIDQGIPQFIRDFSINPNPEDGTTDPTETLTSKIVNEVGNSFEFYARQFSGERIEQMLVSSEFAQVNLLNTLETELKVRLRKFTPIVTSGAKISDMDAIYAMGACIVPPTDALSEFNFLEDQSSKARLKNSLFAAFKSYKEIVYVFLVCVAGLIAVFIFLQAQLKMTQVQFEQLTAKEGMYKSDQLFSIQAELQQNTDKLAKYKGVRTKSDIAFIILRVASHLPEGALLRSLDIKYGEGDSDNVQVNIDMTGDIIKEDPHEQIEIANQVFSDLKNDKELSRFVKNVNLDSLKREDFNGRQATEFNIHCS